MTPREAGAGREVDPLSIPSPLGLRHWNGFPVTPEDCRTEYRKACEENTARAAQLKALEGSKDPDEAREHAALCRLARLGHARVRAWGGLDALARLAQEEGEL